MRFIKNESRHFDLNKNIEEIIEDVLEEGQNQYEALMDSPPQKRSQTAGPIYFPKPVKKESQGDKET